jgi:hypothetical protein
MRTKDTVIQHFWDSKVQYKQDKHHTGVRCRLCVEHSVASIVHEEYQARELHVVSNPAMPLPEMRSEADIRAEGVFINLYTQLYTEWC